MTTRHMFLSMTGIAFLAFAVLRVPPVLAADDLNAYSFKGKDGNPVEFPADVPVYWKERPGPWRGLEEAHDVTIKTRTRKKGLESSRVIHMYMSHKDTEGNIKAIYVLDKDSEIIGHHKFKEKAGPELEAEVEITGVINYVEINAECSKHGMWKKNHRFV